MIKDEDQCIGGIGVSGRLAEEDLELARHALAHIKNRLAL